MSQFRKRALARLAIFCLGTSALTIPVLAVTYNVGGGTITTLQADNSVDRTGSGRGFSLRANTTGPGDIVTINNVTINNASGGTGSTTDPGQAINIGNSLQSAGSYSIVMHGSSLNSGSPNSISGLGTGAFLAEATSGGNVTFDSTGGAATRLQGTSEDYKLTLSTQTEAS